MPFVAGFVIVSVESLNEIVGAFKVGCALDTLTVTVTSVKTFPLSAVIFVVPFDVISTVFVCSSFAASSVPVTPPIDTPDLILPATSVEGFLIVTCVNTLPLSGVTT